MSPEVIKQTGHNRYTDIWSLGCTVYELLVGKPPWSDKKDIFSVFLSIANTQEAPKLPNSDKISPELKNFLDLCFKRDPYQRANVYELLRHPFIDVKGKIQKYHFTLDKIEEEATPVPSNSEHSRKRGSSSRGRSGGVPNDGSSNTKHSQEGGGSVKKSAGGPSRKRRFFPSTASNDGGGLSTRGEQTPDKTNYSRRKEVRNCDEIVEEVHEENKESRPRRNGKRESVPKPQGRGSKLVIERCDQLSSKTSKSSSDEGRVSSMCLSGAVGQGAEVELLKRRDPKVYLIQSDFKKRNSQDFLAKPQKQEPLFTSTSSLKTEIIENEEFPNENNTANAICEPSQRRKESLYKSRSASFKHKGPQYHINEEEDHSGDIDTRLNQLLKQQSFSIDPDNTFGASPGADDDIQIQANHDLEVKISSQNVIKVKKGQVKLNRCLKEETKDESNLRPVDRRRSSKPFIDTAQEVRELRQDSPPINKLLEIIDEIRKEESMDGQLMFLPQLNH